MLMSLIAMFRQLGFGWEEMYWIEVADFRPAAAPN